MASLVFEPLRVDHLPELAVALRHPAVYEHIGGEVPSLDEFVLGLTRALAGPPSTRPQERWLNFLMREASSSRMVGRLEATLTPGRAEVAFLVDPRGWGHGYGSTGLAWLHSELINTAGPLTFWAATVPANRRCQALLPRSGYVEVPASAAPELASYEAGDLVFRRGTAA